MVTEFNEARHTPRWESNIAAMERFIAQLGAAAFDFFSGRQAVPPPTRKKRARR